MAGLIARLSQVFGASDKQQSSDAAGDARDQQIELLQQVRRGAAEVAASRRALAQQQQELAAQMDTLTLTAKRAVERGRSELAREALARKHGLAAQLSALEAQHDQLQREEEQLVITSTRLQAKLDAIATRQRRDLAQMSAAEAQQRVAAAIDSMSDQLGAAEGAVQAGAASVAASQELLQVEPAVGIDDGVSAELAAIHAEVAQQAADAAQTNYQQPGGAGGQIQDEWGS